MAALVVKNFMGLVPALEAHTLPDSAAQIARGCDFSDGTLRGMRVPAPVASVTRTGRLRSLYRFGRDAETPSQWWFTSNNDLDFVRNPATGDTQERTYYTGDGEPRSTDSTLATGGDPMPFAHRSLGLPIPGSFSVSVVDINATIALGAVNLIVNFDLRPNLSVGSKITFTGFLPKEYNTTHTVAEVVTPTQVRLETAKSTVGDALPTQTGKWTVSQATTETRSYVLRFLSTQDEPGPPTDPVTVTISPHQVARVTSMPTTLGPSALTKSYDVNRKELFRTIPGNNQTNYFRVAQLNLATPSHDDTATYAAAVAKMLDSQAWLAPPDNMRGLRLMNNGIALGFSDNTLHVSEAYRLYAWPESYKQSTDFKIVAIGAFGNFAGVLTQGTPYFVAGSVPRSLSMVSFTGAPACVSKPSVAEDVDGVYYAGPDGLCKLSRSGVEVVTYPVMGQDAWRALVPNSIHGRVWRGAYIGFFDTGSRRGSFIYVPGQRPFIVESEHWFEATYVDPKFGHLYGVRDKVVYQLDGEISRQDWVWRSKKFQLPEATNFRFGRVIGTGSVLFRLFADGALKHTRVVADAEPFSLPKGFKAIEYEIELASAGSVRAVGIAHSDNEIRAVVA